MMFAAAALGIAVAALLIGLRGDFSLLSLDAKVEKRSSNYTANFCSMLRDINQLKADVKRIDENQQHDWDELGDVSHAVVKLETDVATHNKSLAVVADIFERLVADGVAKQVSPSRRKVAGRKPRQK